MRKLKVMMAVAMIFSATVSFGQTKYYTKNGKIEFYSRATLEDIDAKNKTVAAILDSQSGATQFSVLMKGFEFEKALMQEHFNENYVESDKYPKGEFKGTITNNKDIDYSKDGTYTAKVQGKLTIHGVTKDVQTTGTIKISGGKLQTNAVFNIQVSDYNIKIPALVKDKVSNTIKVSVDCLLEPLK